MPNEEPKPKSNKARAKVRRKPQPKPQVSNHQTWEPEVIPQEGLTDFHIQSEGDPSIYYVIDLMAYNGKGRCTCEDWEMRVGPMRSRGIEPIHKSCKHIRLAFQHVGEELIRKLAKGGGDGKR